MRKNGYSYEAHVEVVFETEKQARDFSLKNTTIGERVALDLEDDEVLELFETEEQLLCEIIFPDGHDLAVDAELAAARHAGAEITVTCRWAKNGG